MVHQMPPLSPSLFRVSFQYFFSFLHIILYTILPKVPVIAPSVFVSTTDIVAGDTVNLTCDYALTPSVDVTVSVTWMVNGSGVDTSKDGHDIVTSNGGQLIIFSSVTTSDTGRYTCALSITSPHTAFIKLLGPVQSTEKEIIVQSIGVYCTLYV